MLFHFIWIEVKRYKGIQYRRRAVTIAHLLWRFAAVAAVAVAILSVNVNELYNGIQFDVTAKRHIGEIASAAELQAATTTPPPPLTEYCVTKYTWSELNEEDCAFVVLFFSAYTVQHYLLLRIAPCPSLTLSTIPSYHELMPQIIMSREKKRNKLSQFVWIVSQFKLIQCDIMGKGLITLFQRWLFN